MKQDNHPILTVSPCMFRNSPLRYTILMVFSMAGTIVALFPRLITGLFSSEPGWGNSLLPWISGVSLVFLIVSVAVYTRWWLESVTTRLVLMPAYCEKRVGIISRHSVRMAYENVQNAYVKQGILERLLGVGTVGLSSSGQHDVEIVIQGVKHPGQIIERIQQVLQKGKHAFN